MFRLACIKENTKENATMSHKLLGQKTRCPNVITSHVCHASGCSDPIFHVAGWDLFRNLCRPLNWVDYSQRFHLLLHLEEFHMKTEIEKYNQSNVPLSRHKRNTYLVVLKVMRLTHNKT